MEQTRDLTTLTRTELIGILRAHEARLSAREERINEGAFYVRNKGTVTTKNDNKNRNTRGNKWCDYCKRKNHTEAYCWQKEKDKDPSKVKCYNCGKMGHYSKECRSKKNEQARVTFEEEEEDSSEEHMIFCASEVTTTILKEDQWLVDSGCTNHMTRDERYFSRLDRSIKIPIKVGNGDMMMTAGKGDVDVLTPYGKKTIRNVFLVPRLEKNLLSVSQIILSGYQVCFQDKRCVISDAKGKKILDVQMANKSFIVKMSLVQKEEAMSANVEDHMAIWYKRLGHVGNTRLQ